MKGWNRTLAALLAAIMLVMPFGATAEPALEFNVLPEADAGIELEIAPEAIGDATDLELELPDASELDELDIEDIDLDAVTLEDVVIDGAEAEAGDSVQTNDDDEDDYLIPGLYAYDEYCVDDDDYYYCNDEISETSLKIGEQLKLIVIYTDGHTVTWSSSDGKVATVKDGTITAIEEGSCTITATLSNGTALKCDVLVVDFAELSETKLSMEVGSTDELWFYDLGDRTVTWSSSDEKVATVKDGTVTAIGEGTCTITATLSNGKVFECEVSVYDNCALYEYESSYWDDDEYYDYGTEIHSAILDVSETLDLIVIYKGDRSVAWSSSNDKVATVKDGTVTAIGEGTCTITATLSNGKALKCALTVKDAAELSDDELSMNVGSTYELEVYDLGNRTVTWSSSDTTVATVKDGTVTAIREGACTITATLSNGKALKCALNVNDPAVLSKTELSMNAGATYELKVSKFGNRTVTWSSSDTTVATVKAGTVTAIREGTCTITATLSNGKALKCALNVKDVAKLSKAELSLNVGSTYTLKVSSLGNRTVTWSSSDDKVATVKDGTVTAIREGACTITATPSNGKALKCTLTVKDPAVLSKAELSMNAGATYELKVSKFGNRTVTWSSSDTTVATVKAGTVTAIREGTCTITATLSNGKALNCVLTITDLAELSETKLSMKVGATYELEVSDLGNRTVTWSSSDDKVATVKDGTVTAIREGACTITATPSNGKALKCTLTVKDPAVLSKTVLSLNVGATDTLKVSNLGNRTVTWSSSDDKVATVKAGTVTAIREGSCTITATLSNGKALNCVLTVKDPAKLSKAELSMNIGEKYALKVSDLGNRTVTWSSSDTTVATVKDGTVTAIKAGKCSITATLSNGKALNCALSVKDAAELSKTELSINIGAKYALKVTNLGNRTVTWSSSNKKVATVKNGTVTAIKAGKCTITAKVTNGKTLTCKVTVKDAAKLFRTKLAMNAGATSKLKIINLGHRTVTWSSSDKKVATVKGGTVTAIKAGKCTITAKIKNGKILKCKVTVRDAARLSKTKLSLNVGRTYKLKVNEAGNRTVTWSSSDKSIATVKNGTVTAIKAGKCTITATPGNGKALKCILTVKDPAWISKTKLSMNAGATTTLKVYRPGTRKVAWSSSDKKVATVKNGTVTAIKAGKCTITATLSNGQTFDCKVTVKDAARFTETKLSLKPGESQTLRISGLYGREVAWTSSDEKIATVKNGTVTAVYIGSCTVTGQIKNGKKLTCTVTVTDAAALSNDKLTISNIDTDRITLTGGLNRKVTWSTSNKNVVEITGSDNDSASIKAVKNGAATITAKVEGGKTLKCVVKVVDPLTIELDEIDEESIYNKVWVYFNNHSNKKITYVTLDIAQYNNRGDKLESPYSYFYLNETVAPHDSLHHYYWVNDDTKKVKIRITEVTFADKTTWKP